MLYRYRGMIFAIFIALLVCYFSLNNRDIDPPKQEQVAKLKLEAAEDKPADIKEALPEEIMTSNQLPIEQIQLTPSQVEEIVKNYLLNNPKVITDALDHMQQQKMAEMYKKVEQEIVVHEQELNRSFSPTIGNSSGDSIVVMFYDINCGYCKQSSQALDKLILDNPKVKIILKPYPILGAESEYLAKLSLAVYQEAPDKFKEIHDELMSNNVYNKESIGQLLQSINIDTSKIENLVQSEEIGEQMKATMQLAKELKINGVPAFIINGKYYPGYLTFEQLLEKTNKPSENKEVLEAPVIDAPKE